ncbi:TonB-dependent receptor [Abyssibacter sp.]|uniref:TonB-dependent receptor n=1 Tax=Abyssibacter sp. TaxID=2320200 RepID=UPI0025BB17D6|nr:TonB-dependent receptor [Abyssibacter sp.]MCK5859747.1 TonB-dependent receptor [Abyssibacter sp.]
MIESSTMRRVCAVCAFAGMGLVPAALAQSEADEIETVPTIPVAALDPEDVPTEMDADTIELEELVVTAQKTRQTLREVPASVSAISGEQLAEANILLPNDVNNYVPNLTMKITPYLSEVRIRGYGTTISNLGAESSVGTVIDGVYYGRSTFLSSMLYDVGQFEVIRGPQGSLFGKNTIAGVLNLTTREPEPYSEASIRLIGTDNLDQRIAQGGVTIPLSDTAAVRIAGASYGIDGILYNTLLDRPEADFNATYGRIKLRLPEFGYGGRITLGASIANQSFNNNAFQIAELTPTVFEYMQQFDPQVETDPLNELVSSNVPAFAKVETRSAQANIEYPLNGWLGVPTVDLTSISGYARTTTIERDIDFDFSPVPALLYTLQEPSPYEQYSQELRVSGLADSLFGLFGETEFILGAYYFDADSFNNEFIEIEDLGALAGLVLANQADNPGSGDVVPTPGLGGGIPIPPAVVDALTQIVMSPLAAEIFAAQGQNENVLLTLSQQQRSMALFGQVTTEILKDLHAIVGLRVGREDKDAYLTSTAPDGAIFIPAVIGQSNHQSSLSRSEDEVSPKLGLRYDMGRRASTYAIWARGFKSGGFNGIPLNDENLEFEPERADSYEVGFKARLLNNTLHTNIAIFHTDFENLQVSTFTGSELSVLNAAAARTRGFEADLRWLPPIRAFELDASVGYTDAYYTSYPNAPAPAFSDDSSQDLTGQTLQNAPKWSVSVLPKLLLPGFSPSWGIIVNLEALYTSERYLDVDLDPATLQDDTITYNARLSVGAVDRAWGLTVSLQNITDERVLSQVTDLAVAPGNYGAVTTTVGRSVYGALSFEF